MVLTIDLNRDSDFQLNKKIRDANMRDDRRHLTAQEVADKYEISLQSVYVICDDIDGPSGPRRYDDVGHVDPARTEEMVQKYENGATLEEIGKQYGISRERVRQLLAPSGVTKVRKVVTRATNEELEKIADEARAAVRAEREAKIEEGLAIIEGGASIACATAAVGLPNYVLIEACKAKGIKTMHGRWRDNTAIAARVRVLRAEGRTWAEIFKICKDEKLANISAMWVARHCPDLVQHRKS